MKKQLKSYFRALTLALTMLLAWQCQTEEVAIENSNEIVDLSVTKFTSSEIPDIVSSFQERIDKRSEDISAKDGEPAFWVDEESAIGVSDSIGNMTYSFVMHVADGGENSLYNLVINRRVDRNNSPDFVMRYEFIDQDVFEYSQMEEKEFKGKIDAFSFESFIQSLGEAAKGNITEPCYDDMAELIPSGNGGGGSGGTGTGGSTSGGGGGSSYTPSNTTSGWGSIGSYGVSGGGSYSTSVQVGKGCFCNEALPDTAPDQKSYTSKADDCPKGEMDIAINVKDGIFHTACRSFQYENFGATGTKVAAVKGIEHPVLRTDRCPGVGYVFPQSTYYFTLPSWKPRAQKESTMALERAFDKLEKYFEDDIPCLSNGQSYVGLLSSKLLEFTKEEFIKIGGTASKYPPAGWNGEEHEYETNVGLFVPDC